LLLSKTTLYTSSNGLAKLQGHFLSSMNKTAISQQKIASLIISSR
jgi:hypothetical protein